MRFSTAAALAEAFLLSNTTRPQLVQVGAGVGDFDPARFGHRSDAVREAIYLLLDHASTRALLVEPNPPVYDELHAKVRERFGAKPVNAVNVAMCAEETSDHLDLFVASPRLVRDLPKTPRWARNELSSTIRTSILGGLKMLLGPKRSSDAASYIDSVRVPCRTPQTLLHAAQLMPADVDVLVVDAEGSDAAIVHAFLLAGCRPSLIFFEAHIAMNLRRDDLSRLVQLLRSLGYHLDCRTCYYLLRPAMGAGGDPLWPPNPLNSTLPKPRDSGANGLAWDPSRVSLAGVMDRHAELANWYSRTAKV